MKNHSQHGIDYAKCWCNPNNATKIREFGKYCCGCCPTVQECIQAGKCLKELPSDLERINEML